MKYKLPVFKNLRATTIPKAYFLNAVAVAIIAALSIETRQLLNDEKSNFYSYFNELLSGKGLTETQKVFIVFASSFIIAIVTYLIMFLLFDYGRGMLAPMDA